MNKSDSLSCKLYIDEGRVAYKQLTCGRLEGVSLISVLPKKRLQRVLVEMNACEGESVEFQGEGLAGGLQILLEDIVILDEPIRYIGSSRTALEGSIPMMVQMYCKDYPYFFMKLNIIEAWVNNRNAIHWTWYEDKFVKDAWLAACLAWGDAYPRSSYPKKLSGVIEVEKILCAEDIFCCLGESLLGPRGYIGLSTWSAEECFVDLLEKGVVSIEILISDEKDFLKKIEAFPNDFASEWANFVDKFAKVIELSYLR
jgi:hypothetical protein